jgi:hypothetical protein
MEHRNTQSGFTIEGRIDKKVHNTGELREQVEDWDSLSKEQKMLVTRAPEQIDFDSVSDEDMEYAEMYITPEEDETVYNVTTTRFHEYIVDNLDPAQTAAKDNVDATWMALGTDAASGTSTSDTDLNTRVYSETVTDHADNGNELLASTFIDSTEANGNTVDEIGLFTGDISGIASGNIASSAPDDVFMLNHATFASVTKDNTKTVTFDVTLTFSDV